VSQELIIKSLGVSNYLETLALMHAHIKSDDFQDEVWMLEHPPVFTLGTAADKNHVINPKDIPVIQSDRGGEVTYHGPGQLVIYLMIDIKKTKLGPKSLVRNLQEFIQSLLAEYSIESNFIEGAPGVHVNEKKIASIGLRISKGKTYHGISINVDMDLKPFSFINPCGYKDLEVVQIKDFNENITMKEVEVLAIKKLGNIF
jgi:lipoyl(octanoyl) transferase